MKHKIIFPTILVLSLSFFGNRALAQQNTDPQVKGFWQLITNVHEKKTVTVQFYTTDGQLMYQETLHNTKLKIDRKKVQHKLNDALREAYQTWTITHATVAANDLVSRRITN